MEARVYAASTTAANVRDARMFLLPHALHGSQGKGTCLPIGSTIVAQAVRGGGRLITKETGR